MAHVPVAYRAFLPKPTPEKWPCAARFGFIVIAGGFCWLALIAAALAVLP